MRGMFCAILSVNRNTIERVLGGSISLQVNGVPVPLMAFVNDILTMGAAVARHLQLYNGGIINTARYGTDAVWNNDTILHPNVPQEQSYERIRATYATIIANEATDDGKTYQHNQMIVAVAQRLVTLNNYPVAYRTDLVLNEIRDIQYFQADENYKTQLASLQAGFMQWVNANDSHTNKEQKLRQKLANPQVAILEIEEALNKYELAYNTARQKSENNEALSKEESKLLKDYEKVQGKLTPWQGYAEAKANLEIALDTEKVNADSSHEHDGRIKTVSLIHFCLNEARNVERLFHQLNNAGNVGGYVSRGFSSNPDHSLLESYQIMTGSGMRSLIDNPRFMAVAPDRLKQIMEETCKPSRGYLSHLGVRQEGHTLSESMDRATVFQGNSEQTVEAIRLLHTTAYALERNITYDRAERDTNALVLFQPVGAGQQRI